MHKKGHKLKTSPLIKNLQFSSNLADSQAKLPTHEAIILTKFHKECKRNVDFLHRQKDLARAPFLCITLYSAQNRICLLLNVRGCFMLSFKKAISYQLKLTNFDFATKNCN